MNVVLITLIITIINFMIWTIFDYLGFYFISKIRFQDKDLRLTIYFLISITLSVINLWLTIIANILEIIIFYLWFKDRSQKPIVLGSILIVEIMDVFGDILINILQISQPETIRGTLISELTNLILVCFFFALIFYTRNGLYNLLSSTEDKSFLYILGYFYISIEVFATIVEIKDDKQVIIISLFIIMLLQSIFISLVFHFNYSINKKILNAEKQKQLQEHIEDIEGYANYLEKSEDDLLRFKHDVKNLLSSVNLEKNSNESKLLTDYVEKYINDNTLKDYKDLNHIKVKPLKNLILTKITNMIHKNIDYSFECTRIIETLPPNIEIFDLVRILGIALDNAIEASENLGKQGFVNIMLFKNDEQGIEFEVENPIDDKNVSVDKLLSKGYTTKSKHNGIGLFNVEELIAKYPNLSLDLYTEDMNFVFYLVVDEE